MTAKRFEYDKDICCFIDNNEFQIKAKSVNEIVDLLNELHEENQQLKKELGLLAEFNQKPIL